MKEAHLSQFQQPNEKKRGVYNQKSRLVSINIFYFRGNENLIHLLILIVRRFTFKQFFFLLN